MLVCQGLGDLLGGDGAEEPSALAGLGGDFDSQPLQLFSRGLGLRLFSGLLGLPSLLLLLHGVQIFGGGDDRQLFGEQKIARVAVGHIH